MIFTPLVLRILQNLELFRRQQRLDLLDGCLSVGLETCPDLLQLLACCLNLPRVLRRARLPIRLLGGVDPGLVGGLVFPACFGEISLDRLQLPLQLDSLTITNGHLTYCERLVVGADPGVLTVAALSMSVAGIANRGAASAAIRFQAQGELMDVGTLKVQMSIPRRCDRAKGFKVLPKRWIVERTFGWLSKSRRLCRDYEVRLDHSESMVRICMIRIMLRRLAKIA
jgi:hypothetical protein